MAVTFGIRYHTPPLAGPVSGTYSLPTTCTPSLAWSADWAETDAVTSSSIKVLPRDNLIANCFPASHGGPPCDSLPGPGSGIDGASTPGHTPWHRSSKDGPMRTPLRNCKFPLGKPPQPADTSGQLRWFDREVVLWERKMAWNSQFFSEVASHRQIGLEVSPINEPAYFIC